MRFRFRLFVADEYKPLRLVSPWLWLMIIGALMGQVAFNYWVVPPPVFNIVHLENPPKSTTFRIAALGEPTTLAKLTAMKIQAFDNQPGFSIPFREMNYDVLGKWLDRIVELDERSEYPHFMMSKIYSSVSDNSRRRKAVEWVRQQFLKMPDTRWEWMVHATNLAKYILKDDALALSMARELHDNTLPGTVPNWVRQLEIFFLENQDEFSAAATMLENQLNSGDIQEPQEFKFLSERLEQILEKSYKAGQINQQQAQDRIKKIHTLTEQYLQQYNEE